MKSPRPAGGKNHARKDGRKVARNFVAALFEGVALPKTKPALTSRADVASRRLTGSFPDVVSLRPVARLRAAWFDVNVNTMLSRDVRDLSQVQKLDVFPLLLRLLASRAGGPVNAADLAQSIGVSVPTTQ